MTKYIFLTAQSSTATHPIKAQQNTQKASLITIGFGRGQQNNQKPIQSTSANTKHQTTGPQSSNGHNPQLYKADDKNTTTNQPKNSSRYTRNMATNTQLASSIDHTWRTGRPAQKPSNIPTKRFAKIAQRLANGRGYKLTYKNRTQTIYAERQ